jgi:hypothetical protein
VSQKIEELKYIPNITIHTSTKFTQGSITNHRATYLGAYIHKPLKPSQTPVAISDPATAHFTAHKNLGNTRTAYKPRHTHTYTHPETLEAREKKTRWLKSSILRR